MARKRNRIVLGRIERGRGGSSLGRLAALERGASVLRRVGLGRLVDAVGARAGGALGAFELEIDGLRVAGDHIGQLYYARDLLESNREEFFVELLREAIDPGDSVLEAGAHIGYVTLQAARAAGPEGRVFTFEPNPRTLPVLRRNVEANGFAERVEIIPRALGAGSTRASFNLTPGGDTSSLHETAATSEVVEVEVAAADLVLPPPATVDVVKLDVEGNEVEALRGMRALLARSPDVVVFAECNPEALEAAGSSADELVAELQQQGFDVRWIDEDARRLRPLADPRPSGYVNLRCARR